MKTLKEKLKNHNISSKVKLESYKRAYLKLSKTNNYNSKIDLKEGAIQLTDRYLSIYGKTIVKQSWDM